MENIFLTSHIQPECVPDHKRHWAVQQVQSTVNWGSGNLACNIFSGGLNHQIEHHLFPSMAYYHYSAISPIVKETCAEFGVPYRTFSTLGQAVKSCYSYVGSFAWFHGVYVCMYVCMHVCMYVGCVRGEARTGRKGYVNLITASPLIAFIDISCSGSGGWQVLTHVGQLRRGPQIGKPQDGLNAVILTRDACLRSSGVPLHLL
jgi:hypothetical protein